MILILPHGFPGDIIQNQASITEPPEVGTHSIWLMSQPWASDFPGK